MTKKPFSDIENIIRDASNANEPAFDEMSWQKMEALLDKNKKRRPFVFWIFLIVGLLAAGTFFWKWPVNTIEKTSEPATGKSIQQENPPGQQGITLQPGSLEDRSPDPIIRIQQQEKIQIQEEKNNQTNNTPTHQESIVVNESTALHTGKQRTRSTPFINREKNKVPIKSAGSRKPSVESEMVNNLPAGEHADKKKSIEKNIAGNKAIERPKSGKDAPDRETNASIPTERDSTENSLNVLPDSIDLAFKSAMDSAFPSQKEVKSKIRSRFFVIASIGMETNGTALFKGGKNTVRWGLGAGYQLTRNLSLQAAFYKSEKIYVAPGAAYKATAGTYWSIVDIKSVNADCFVYEIPVMLQYDFSPAKKLHFFVAAGLSSYLMKKEDYEYYYLRNGSPYYGAASYSGNKHLFSAAKLATGISYRLNNRVMLTGSPSIGIPLKGVGEGEINLYSSEVNIGIKYFPLHER